MVAPGAHRAFSICLLLLGCNAERGRESVASVQLQPEQPARPASRTPRAEDAANDTWPSAPRAPAVVPIEGAPMSDSAPTGAATTQEAAPAASPPETTPAEAARSRRASARRGSASRAAATNEAPGTPWPAAPRLDPGASEEFDAATLADVQAALNAVNENAFATLVSPKRASATIPPTEKRVLPNTCRAWRTFRNRGYTPKNALAEQLDAGALVRCGALEFLSRAASSRVSYVRHALDGAGPSGLPAIVASATSKLAQHSRTVAARKELSLAEFLPDARTGTSELRGRLVIDEPASATSAILNAEAWGDINSDETEDLLLSVMNISEDGTYFDMRLIEVTRSAPGAPLTVLAVFQ
jgi:hypothetical protein